MVILRLSFLDKAANAVRISFLSYGTDSSCVAAAVGAAVPPNDVAPVESLGVAVTMMMAGVFVAPVCAPTFTAGTRANSSATQNKHVASKTFETFKFPSTIHEVDFSNIGVPAYR